jgi:HEAT repeat protein
MRRGALFRTCLAALGLLAAAVGGWAAIARHPQPAAQPAPSSAPLSRPAPNVQAQAPAIAPAPVDLSAGGSGGNDLERDHAFQTAARQASPDSIASLAQVAGSGDRLAARAAAALGEVTNHEAAGQLEGLALSDGPTIVRANAVHALGKSGGPDNVDVLCHLAADTSQSLRVRQEAALALAQLHDASAVPRLISALQAMPTGPDPDAEQLRISLVQGLGGIGSPEALTFLKSYASGNLPRDERAFVAKYVAAN